MSWVMICHNYEDSSVSSMSYHFANKLIAEGHNVIFISKAPYYQKEVQLKFGNANLILTSWPSKVKNSSLRDFSWFIQTFKRFRPKVIFGHYNGGLIANILAKFYTFGKVISVDWHHTCSQGYILDKGAFDIRLRIFFWRRALYYHFFCDHVICPSRYALRDLEEFFKYKSGFVVPHALKDRYKFRPSEKADYSGHIRLGYLGRLDSGKNIEDLRSALKAHHDKFENSKIILDLAGFNLDPKKKDKMEDLVYINERGRIDYEIVDDYLQSLDFCIIPSKSDSFNLVAIEALMNDTALIVSNQCGVTDFLEDGIDCIKFFPDIEGISQILEDLEFGNEIYFKLKSREAFLSKFQMDTYLDRMMGFYNRLV